MIKIIFPPGSYGTFLTKCLYHFSNLNNNLDKINFLFDANGSSHDFRLNNCSKNLIKCGHIETLDIDYFVDRVITMLPDSQHYLDYFDNQFIKQEFEQTVKYINNYFSFEEINKKLQTSWNYTGNYDHNTPKWIVREWTSFWINDCLIESYNTDKYQKILSLEYYNVNEIFDNLYLLIEKIAKTLNLKLIASKQEIDQTQLKFVQHQRLHNIQLKCQEWVYNITQGNNVSSPCVTIFDEAYVQMLLRTRGYEIKCEGLNDFPSDSSKMLEIIYTN